MCVFIDGLDEIFGEDGDTKMTSFEPDDDFDDGRSDTSFASLDELVAAASKKVKSSGVAGAGETRDTIPDESDVSDPSATGGPGPDDEFAFTWSKKTERIQVISSWDSEFQSSFNEKKVPTAISFGRNNKVTWGYNIAFDADQARWFKLLLIDDEDLPEDVRNSAKINEARQYLSKHNKTATEVAALFLRQLWNHSIQRITETASRNVLNYSKFHIVITLPAIWPAYACTRMKEVATLAGMLANRGVGGDTELSFVSEPEAAALATLSDMEGRCDIKAGDSFVVVDCGGGTVDLISYEVVSLSPMVVKECIKGQGGLCGSVFVDEALTSILEREFGKKQWAKMSTDSRKDLLYEKWELGIKSSFGGDEKIWKFTMPFECLDKKALKAIQARNPLPKITITDNDIRGAFDMVLGKILQMLDEQVQAVQRKNLKNPKVMYSHI
ncbi:hypothetical protein NEMBOFW57_007172 [Staphylotrichum longicolle]|uniref:Uncharacterized protein n=1 Tax=Staphylotrichum longicolle TaxID=669026 RepID=A0AAD4HV08_9PEZI|nr:hypothetical protein NEMBOFW57_007172 [Staphylotrichum longicolle]